jgi:copper resistance protein B
MLLSSFSLPHCVFAQEWSAADSYFDPEVMEQSRNSLMHHHGGQVNYLLIAERLEIANSEDNHDSLSELQGWVGTDYNRFWFKSDIEYSIDESSLEELEIQTLYSKPVSAFFDLQAGMRHNTNPGKGQTFGVLGVQGLSQYFFELDLAYFLSEKGRSSFRGEFEYDLLLTQRLILQPRGEVNFAVGDDVARGVDSGLTEADAGIRLRYEVTREFAPYIGSEVKWSDGASRDEFRLLCGVRVWF